MVKPSDQQGTREKIVAAAGELIVEVGWANTTTRSISKRAGVNNALIHYYFGSKDDLLLEAAAAAFAEEVEGPLAMLADAESVTDALKGTFDWVASIDVHSPVMIITMEAAREAIRDARIAELLEGVWDGFFRAIAAFVTHAQTSGEIRDDIDPMGVATVFGAMLDGLFLYRLVAPGFDIDAASLVATTLIDSLKGQQS
jgi:AcrR family transcriptional regulator